MLKTLKIFFIILIGVIALNFYKAYASDCNNIVTQAMRAGISPEFYQPRVEECEKANAQAEQASINQQNLNQLQQARWLDEAMQEYKDKLLKNKTEALNAQKIIQDEQDKKCKEVFTGEKSHYNESTKTCTCNIGYRIYDKVCEIERKDIEGLSSYEEKRIDETFKKHFGSAMANLPEYKDIVDPKIIKAISLDPRNGSKTFEQIIIERYSGELATKKALIPSVPPVVIQNQVRVTPANNSIVTPKVKFEDKKQKVTPVELDKRPSTTIINQELVATSTVVQPKETKPNSNWWQKMKRVFKFW